MPETIAQIGEFGLIDRIHKLLKETGASLSPNTLGMGDDCALFRPRPGRELLVTCDSLVEGRHYLPRFISSVELGRRAMVQNISDIGAMGGRPLYALVSLGLRPDTPVRYVDGLYRGFTRELNLFGAAIVGGNLTGSQGAEFIDITLIGEAPSGRAVLRSTARPGDRILVTGYPGQAAAGLQMLLHAETPAQVRDHPLARAYRTPSHRAREGEAVAASGLATSMIDTSDGLAGDLGHICHRSGVGAVLLQDNLPVSPAMREAALAAKQAPHDLVLRNSDDYELIVTCPPKDVEEIRSIMASVDRVPVAEIGSIVAAAEGSARITMISPGGASREIAPSGWNHFSNGSTTDGSG